MARIVLKAKALKWGNSYGFRIAKADFEKAGLTVGQEVEVQVGGEPGKVDISHIRTFSMGGFAGKYHDDILYLGTLEKLVRTGQVSAEEFEREKAKIRRRTHGHVGG
jgi:hypothetical protein